MSARIKARLAAIHAGKAAVVGAALSVSSQVFAAIPVEATAAFTAMETDGGAMVGDGWPILVAVTGGLILMGIFKKVLSRAT